MKLSNILTNREVIVILFGASIAAIGTLITITVLYAVIAYFSVVIGGFYLFKEEKLWKLKKTE